MAESFVDSFKTELIADRVWRTRSQLEQNVPGMEMGLDFGRGMVPEGLVQAVVGEPGDPLDDRQHRDCGLFEGGRAWPTTVFYAAEGALTYTDVGALIRKYGLR